MHLLIRQLKSSILNSFGALKKSNIPFVLMYHRIIYDLKKEPAPLQPGMYVTQKTFEKHIKFLSKEYKILPLVELLSNYFAGKAMEYCCSLTFDDGWKDNYLYAFPVLKKNKVTASFFIPTAFIDTSNCFWDDELSCFLYNNSLAGIKQIINFEILPKEIIKNIETKHIDYPQKITRIIQLFKNVNPSVRHEIIDAIKHNKKDSSPNIEFMMRWNDIKKMHQ